MEGEVRSWELVEHLFDASVSPERLDALIAVWDNQIETSGLGHGRLADAAGSAFAEQVAGVLQILEQLHAAELRRVNDLLSGLLGAAMVFGDDGTVVAGGEGILQLRPTGLERTVLVHLKPMQGGAGPPRVLAVTSELPWTPEIAGFLAKAFALTPAEATVARMLAAGGTVAGIAAATGRSAGTVRAQLHAALQKTGTQSQAELVRLLVLLLQSVPADAEPRRSLTPPEPHQRFLRMPDGRRIEVLTLGDPAGRPVIWMQSTYGFWRLPHAAEADFARRGLRVLAPFRAGWCGSDPPPPGQGVHEVAVADLRALMLQLRIGSAVVVAPGDDFRVALMLAKAEPARVRAIFGIGSGFPIRTDAQYRRLIPIARFVRACARYGGLQREAQRVKRT